MEKSKLKTYSLLTASITFMGSANAQIFYTDINPDEIIDTNTNFMFDIDNNGTIDFMFGASANTYTALSLKAESIYVKALGNNHILTTSNNSNSYLLASALELNDTIGLFNNNPSSAASSILLAGHALIGTSSINSGQWYNVDNKYLGFKFEKNNDTYYGWLRASVNISPTLSLTIKDYAYQTSPDTPILAGEKSNSIKENQLKNTTNIYYQNANIIIKSTKKVDIKIYNIEGRLINKINQVDNYKIDESIYTKGVYIIKINDSKEEITKKVIL